MDEDGGEERGDKNEIQRRRDEEIEQVSPSRAIGSCRIARSETQGVG